MRRSLHAGLVVIIPSVSLIEQQRLFGAALDELTQFGELINHVIEVDIEGSEATFNIYEFPVARGAID